MYHTGLVSVSFRDLSPEEIIHAIKIAGLKWIEWGSDVHAPCTDKKRLQEIAMLQQAEDITCSSYGTYFVLGQDKPEALLPYIEAAKILGTSTLRLWCGETGSRAYTPLELAALYCECRQAAQLAEEHQVTLCMECHNDTLTDRKESALQLMKAVNSPSFRMYWQPNQHLTQEENIAYVQSLAPYIHHVHVFNWFHPFGGELERYSLAEGLDIWTQYLSCLTGDRTLLLEFVPDDRIESLYAEASALHRLVKRLEK